MYLCVMVQRYRVCVSHVAKGSYMCVSWCKKIVHVSHGLCVCLMMQKDCACVSYGGKTYVCLMVKNEHVCESHGAELTCACLRNEVYTQNIYYICVYHRVHNFESFTIGHMKQLYIHLECCCTCSIISTSPHKRDT